MARWSPYAAVAVVLLWTVLLVAKCTGGGARVKPEAAPGRAPATTEPRDAPAGDEIQMDDDAVRPPRKQ
jgi:hypothetical protein